MRGVEMKSPATKPDRVWWVDSEEEMIEILEVLRDRHYNESIDRFDEVERLTDILCSLPGFPPYIQGDHIEVRIRPRAISTAKRLIH
jgi:hypothetical protein